MTFILGRQFQIDHRKGRKFFHFIFQVKHNFAQLNFMRNKTIIDNIIQKYRCKNPKPNSKYSCILILYIKYI